MGGSTFFSTKHGRPPRPSRDRFFPRTIYSFTFYSHRAFDNSWMAEDKLVSTLADHLSLPFRSGCGDVVGRRMFLEKRCCVFQDFYGCFDLLNFFFRVLNYFFREYYFRMKRVYWILSFSFNYFFLKTIFKKGGKKEK